MMLPLCISNERLPSFAIWLVECHAIKCLKLSSKLKLARPVVTRAAEKTTEPDHRANLPLFAPACFC